MIYYPCSFNYSPLTCLWSKTWLSCQSWACKRGIEKWGSQTHSAFCPDQWSQNLYGKYSAGEKCFLCTFETIIRKLMFVYFYFSSTSFSFFAYLKPFPISCKVFPNYKHLQVLWVMRVTVPWVLNQIDMHGSTVYHSLTYKIVWAPLLSSQSSVSLKADLQR